MMARCKVVATALAVAWGTVRVADAADAPSIEFAATNTEVVVAAEASDATWVAVREMTNFLAHVFGCPVPVMNLPTDGKRSIYLGVNGWSKAAGLNPSILPRDAFQVKAVADGVVIAGVDSAVKNPENLNYLGSESMWQPQFERATLFGVYDFLEKFLGVRMYFPGELGTVVPHRDAFAVPADTDYFESPDYSVRRYGYADGIMAKELTEDEGRDATLVRRLNFYRLRGETAYIPCCHGQNKFEISRRFKASHPEYFCLFKNPSTGELVRDVDPKIPNGSHHGQLCQSSRLWDEMYEDIVAYLKGKSPSSRDYPDGMEKWGRNVNGRYIDVMPQDGMILCQCEKCQAAYAAFGKNDPDCASDLIWNQVIRLGNRIKAAGLDGRITMMSYTPYRKLPSGAIPDNVDVMVARFGPWAKSTVGLQEKHLSDIRAWAHKLGRKVWVWNYADKVAGLRLPLLPNMTPRAYGEYYKGIAPYVFGAFCESETDYWVFNYLNYYVFSRVCWNNSANVDEILDEHYRLMFGAAAPEMKAFYEGLEDKWVNGVVLRVELQDKWGPRVLPPSDHETWERIYSPDVLAAWRGLFERALNKVAPASIEDRRLRFFRTALLGPLEKGAAAYFDARSIEKELAWRAARADSVNLIDPKKWQGAVFDPNVTLTGEPSIRNTSTERNHIVQKLGDRLKPDTRYRMSWFMRTKDVVPKYARTFGACAELNADGRWKYSRVPDPNLEGSSDWRAYSLYLTTGTNAAGIARGAYACLRMIESTGTAWFDGVRVEECPAEPVRAPAWPLAVGTPGASLWCSADDLTAVDAMTRDGSSAPVRLTLKQNGRTFRLCGLGEMPALRQVKAEVRATETVFAFAEEGAKASLSFLTPVFGAVADAEMPTFVTLEAEGEGELDCGASEWRVDGPADVNGSRVWALVGRRSLARWPAERIIREYPALREKAKAFDVALCRDMMKCGRESYAQLGAFVWRTAQAARGDVYARLPLLVLSEPDVLRREVISALASAPETLPADAAARLLIATGVATVQLKDPQLASPYRTKLARLAETVEKAGWKTPNQDVNTSIRILLGLTAQARLLRGLGATDEAKALERRIGPWRDACRDQSIGGAFGSQRGVFDVPNSWSLKSDLVWERILGGWLFFADYRWNEMNGYNELLGPYGVAECGTGPAANIGSQMRAAALASSKNDVARFASALLAFIRRTSDRRPLVSGYGLEDLRFVGEDQADLCGVFMPLVLERMK